MPISAKVIADTVNPAHPDARIITIEYEAPRYILAEINTHGVLAKSAASSRAIPVKKRIEMATTEPFVPPFGKNKPGMQSDEPLSPEATAAAEEVWSSSCAAAITHARLMEGLEAHKQVANRILEPYVYVKGVLTGTEWQNFFYLRCHPDADPVFQELADAIHEAYVASTPIRQPFHLPYTDDHVKGVCFTDLFKVSAARCARISYRTFDGVPSTVEKDLEIFHKLTGTPPHMSPFDHPAVADHLKYREADQRHYWASPRLHGRYWGWTPWRATVERQLGYVSRRDSFEPLEIQR